MKLRPNKKNVRENRRKPGRSHRRKDNVLKYKLQTKYKELEQNIAIFVDKILNFLLIIKKTIKIHKILVDIYIADYKLYKTFIKIIKK